MATVLINFLSSFGANSRVPEARERNNSGASIFGDPTSGSILTYRAPLSLKNICPISSVRRESVTLLCCDLRTMSIHQLSEFDDQVFPPFRLIAGILRFVAASTLIVAPILTAKSNPQFPSLPPSCDSDNLVVTESV